MYSFLRRPAWILSHLLVLALVVVLIGLGFWQRSRWIEERVKQDQVERRASGAPSDLHDVVDPRTRPGDVPDDVRYRRVELQGTWDVDAEVAVLNRSQGGAPGAWVLTPLLLDDGTAVAVVRGWIPYDPAGVDPPFADALPPGGEVTVTGRIQLTQERGSFGPVDAPDGELDALFRVDVARFARQLDHELAPVWVQLEDQRPAQAGELPRPVPLQTEDPSQNFSYMVQWWTFATIAAVGYPTVLRSVARQRAKGGGAPPEDVADEGRTEEAVATAEAGDR